MRRLEEEEQLALGLYVCGIYTLTLIAFYCMDASPLFFLLFSVVLGLCSCACQVPKLA